MTHIRSRLPLAAAVVALLAAAPGAAEAQLLKKMKDAAKKEAAAAVGLDRKSDSAATASPAAAAESSPSGAAGSTRAARASSASPKRDNGRVTITPETIQVFLTAFDEEIAWHRNEARIAANLKAWEKGVYDYEACKQKAMTDPSAMEGANQAEADKYLEISSRLADEALKVMQANDTTRMRILGDSAQLVSDLGMRAMIPGIKKCGSKPPKPTEKPFEGGSRKALVSAEAKAQFTGTQLGVLRERIGAYVLSNGKFGPGYTSEYMVFSEAELAALAEAMPKLKKLEPHFRDGSLGWGSWYDLGKW